MYGHLDLSKSVQKPKFYLCKPNRTTIAPLSETQNERLYLKLKGVNKLEFDLPYLVQKHNQLVDNKHIGLVKPDYLIYMVYGDLKEYFVVKKPNPNAENSDQLHVQCVSLEDKLRGHKIFSYSSDAVQIDTIANKVLEKTGWVLGTYPSDGKYRNFNITSKTVLEVLNEIEETFDTLLHFDTINKKVNFYSKDYFANFKGLVVSEKRYLQSFLREHNDEEFCTRLYVFGKDGLTINRLNPTGSAYIDDFSYYLYPFDRDSNGNVLSSSDYMSDGLCHAILDYQDLLDTKESEYQTLLDEKSVLLDDMATLESEMDTLESDMAQLEDELFVLQKSGDDTTTKEQEISDKQTEIDDKQTEIDNKQAEIDSKNSEINTLRDDCSESNNFTQSQLDELYGHYVKEDDFRDDNQTDDTSLYNTGLERLQEKKTPEFKVQTNIVNFKEMITEQKHWDKLTLGSVIRVKKESMGQDVKSQVIEIEFDFGNKGINIVQANTTDYIGTEKRMMKYFYLSEEAANILKDKKGVWDSAESDSKTYVDQQISDVNASISNLDKGFEKFASDGFIAKDEAKVLSNQQDQLNSESQDLVNTADNLGITTEKTNYQDALNTLSNELSGYIGQPASDYPIPILSTDRTNVGNAFDNVQDTKSILVNKIASVREANANSYTDTQIDEVNQTTNNLQSQINEFSDDGKLTLSEANSLESTLRELQKESTDIINIADNLGITTEKTNYNNALNDTSLDSSDNAKGLDPYLTNNWINQSGYPLSISSTQRNEITSRLENVQNTKSILVNKISSVRESNANSYTDTQIDEVNTTTNNLQNQIDDFSDDGKLTLAEANSLENTLNELQKESTDILNIASNLGITTEKTDYDNALNNTTLDANDNAKGLDPYLVNNWINQTSYPLDITSTQRSEIKSRLENVQNTKSILINKITTKKNKKSETVIVGDSDTSLDVENADYEVPSGASDAQVYINNAISDLPSSGGVIHLLEGVYDISGVITLKNNVTVKGADSATVLKVNTSISKVFDISSISNVTIKEINIDGADLATNGIYCLSSDNVKINNLSISNASGSAIQLDTCNNIKITDNSLNNNNEGLSSDDSDFIKIINNKIKNNSSSGIDISNRDVSTSGNQIESNVCSDNGNIGIDVAGSSSLTTNNSVISNNICSNNTYYGIFLQIFEYATVGNNVCSYNGSAGMVLKGTTGTVVSNNTCDHNKVVGIHITSGVNITVTQNNSFSNGGEEDNPISGIDFSGDDSVIQGNTSRMGDEHTYKQEHGIYLNSGDNNMVTNNDLINSGTVANFSDNGTNTVVTAGNRL